MTQESDSFVETVYKELAECPICLGPYEDPRILPCLHSLCLKCVTDYGKKKTPENQLDCPICRQEFQVPIGGFAFLQPNFFINRIKDLYQARGGGGGGGGSPILTISLCDACELGNDGETKNADVESFCVECQQKLCTKCCAAHKLFPALRMHQIVGLKSGFGELIKVRTSSCNQHPQEKIQLYCQDCKQAICMLCFALKHKSHKCDSIEEVAETERCLLEDDLKVICDRIEAQKMQEEELELLKKGFCNSVGEIECKIQETAEKLKKAIDIQRGRLIEDLMAKKQMKLKELAQLMQDLEFDRSVIESFNNFASALKESGTHAEIARFAGDAHEKVKTFQQQKMIALPPKSSLELIFKSSDLLNNKSLIGSVLLGEEQRNDSVKLLTPSSLVKKSSSPTMSKPLTKSLITKITGTSCILGITILNKQIYICRIRSPNIDVYNANSYQKLQTFTVNNLKDPSDMTCCLVNGVIYINGQEDRSIYKLDKDGSTIDAWKSKDKPFRISTDDAGCVTATYREALTVKRFTSDGKIMKTLSLPKDMTSPRNAFYITTSDTFVVCHGELGEPFHRVCELSSDGNLVRYYGGNEGSAPTLINVPVHMIRAPRGRYLVADLNNHRIHLIDNFKLVAHILTSEDGIKVPRKLDFYDDKLFVAQDDGNVLVFQVNF